MKILKLKLDYQNGSFSVVDEVTEFIADL